MAIRFGNNRKYLIYILAGLVFILSVALIYIQYNAWSDLKEEIRLEEEELDLAMIRLARLTRYRENAPEYEHRLAVAKALIPDYPGEDELISYIYRVAEDSDMTVNDIRFENRSATEQYTIMPLSINIEGGYQELRRFLSNLYYGERAIRVNNIRISSSSGAETSISVTLSVAAFYNHSE
ncbi:MAG: type 4a pilus biogenesis protein PilO [Firmicutes bacterium]|nr:type 4a pilus biogenesis protein PilO [Bacillota bacterium]